MKPSWWVDVTVWKRPDDVVFRTPVRYLIPGTSNPGVAARRAFRRWRLEHRGERAGKVKLIAFLAPGLGTPAETPAKPRSKGLRKRKVFKSVDR